MRMPRCLVMAWVLICCVATAAAQGAEIRGTVFLDANGNGARDEGERGLAGVMVSDGRMVADTDAEGAYQIASEAMPALLWVSTPRDHRAVGGFSRWADGTRSVDFPLAEAKQENGFLFAQMTDSHVGDANALKGFCERLNAFPLPMAFAINTGDLVGGVDVVLPEQAPQQFVSYRGAVSVLKIPLFDLPGNHEHVGLNHKGASPAHPFYGKGLYRALVGPMHYSWDWGAVHFIALDGSRVPYAEALGDEQRAWLAEDLKRQPKEKPLVLFCHQSLPSLRDAKELSELLAGRRVLGAFCGHLHATYEKEFAGFPLFHTGALSGAWWSGPNPDGSPQGFRLVAIRGEALATAYSGRAGTWSMDIRTPRTREVRKGMVPVEVVLLDLGKEVTLKGSFAGAEFPLTRGERAELWSTWTGEVESTRVPDSLAEVTVTATGPGGEGQEVARFIARNGKDALATAKEDGLLRIQVRGIEAANIVEVNGKQVGTLTPGAPNDSYAEFTVPRDVLKRLNSITVRAVAAEGGKDKDDFSIGPVALRVDGKTYYDPRAESFRRYSVGDNNPKAYGDSVEILICIP